MQAISNQRGKPVKPGQRQVSKRLPTIPPDTKGQPQRPARLFMGLNKTSVHGRGPPHGDTRNGQFYGKSSGRENDLTENCRSVLLQKSSMSASEDIPSIGPCRITASAPLAFAYCSALCAGKPDKKRVINVAPKQSPAPVGSIISIS